VDHRRVPVGQPLSNRTTICTRGARVLAEIEFGKTSIKVLLIDVLIDADKAALHGVFRRRTVRVTISPKGITGHADAFATARAVG
jgi:hypothetical protein